MKFADVIREAGFNPECFPKCSQIPITLYDEKPRKHASETLKFSKPLFQQCPSEHEKFSRFLTQLEEKLEEGTVVLPSMNVQITKDAVVTQYHTPSPHFFFRNT